MTTLQDFMETLAHETHELFKTINNAAVYAGNEDTQQMLKEFRKYKEILKQLNEKIELM